MVELVKLGTHLSTMGRGRKRKRPLADNPPTSTAPALKEFLWTELANILRKHSAVALTHADLARPALNKLQ
jgi:hypothetical protein